MDFKSIVGFGNGINKIEPGFRQLDYDSASVCGAVTPLDKPSFLETVDAIGHCAGSDHCVRYQLGRAELKGRSGATEGRKHVVHPILETVVLEVFCQAPVNESG